MKNYRDSDYALNKYSKGIVYRFADSTYELTLEDYLAENPEKTEQDFQALKALSDEIYSQQDTQESKQTYKNISIHTAKEVSDVPAHSPEAQMEEQETAVEEEKALRTAWAFLQSGKLTVTQKKRFVLYYIRGYSTRKIAKMEGLQQNAIWESIAACEKKLKIFLEKELVTPLKKSR